MLYKDTFNNKFGFRHTDFLGAVIAFVASNKSANGLEPLLEARKYTRDMSGYVKSGLLDPGSVREVSDTASPQVMSSHVSASQASNKIKIDDSVVWQLLRFVLFDEGFVDSRFSERNKAVKSFIDGLRTDTGKTAKRGRSLMLVGIFKLFKDFLYNIITVDVRKTYWSCFGKLRFSCSKGASGLNPHHVVEFVHRIVNATVPCDLLGCESNFVRLKEVCVSLVVLNKGEKLDMAQVMQGFKATGCRWTLKCKGRLTKGQANTILQYICRLVFLILEHMVIPLLQRHFYITEANFSMCRLLYFSKVDWHRMVTVANDGYLSDMTILTAKQCHGPAKTSTSRRQDTTLGNFTKETQSSNFGEQCSSIRVRWIPKLSGMRPIMNCKATNVKRSSNLTHCSLNDIMQMPFQALKEHIRRKPQLLGNGILGYMSAFRSIKRWWVRFKRHLSLSSSDGDRVTLYVTLADLSRCYEHIQHGYLVKALKRIQVGGPLLFKRIFRRELINVASSTNSYSKRVTLLSGDSLSLSPLQVGSLISRSFGQFCICSRYANDYFSCTTSKSDVIRAVTELLTNFRLSLPKASSKDLIHPTIGIPQGCCISPLLCSLYLAQGDLNASIRRLTRSRTGNLLLRWIDDFIFISTRKDDTDEMLQILKNSSAFGVSINEKLFVRRLDLPILRKGSKTSGEETKSKDGLGSSKNCDTNTLDANPNNCVPNVDNSSEWHSVTDASLPTSGSTLLSWINCSFGFDLVRGHLNATLKPWKNQLCSVRDSMNLSKMRFSTFMFALLEQRLLGYISNRLKHGLFTSVEINAPSCIMQNAYVVLRICTMKMVSAMSTLCQHFGGFINTKYFGKLAHKLVDHAVTLISLGGLEVRKHRTRQLLQLAVIYTLSPNWLRRLTGKFGRRRIKFVRSIERKLKDEWPSYGDS
ncbi:telomerase reverse transcriptase [Babesia caballi]|uniref:Telomerase reverse transcriptase n=1 Tax=Babesia caballi TaxID=5871 RepID=A0AAV4LZ80_BABCB|nr:telomerase reverse transcriptase [Babesia caballi]